MKKILLCCESVFQLFNAINLTLRSVSGDSCDVVLSDTTDFSKISGELRNKKIFNKVIDLAFGDFQRSFFLKDIKTQNDIFLNPDNYFSAYKDFDLYDAIFIPLDHIGWKLLYYSQLKRGSKPEIFFYEEGLRSYTVNNDNTDLKERFNHGEYGEKSFFRSVKGMYLYEPSLFGLKTQIPMMKIPKISKEDCELRDGFSCFEKETIPKEKFVFFEESLFADHQRTNDFMLFERIANQIGKNDLVVKCHPRSKINRFSDKGYKIMEKLTTPWEIQIMDNDLSDKVFITIISTASFTPFLIFNDSCKAIHINQLFDGYSPLLNDKGFMNFYNKALEFCNSRNRCVFRPSNFEELRSLIEWFSL